MSDQFTPILDFADARRDRIRQAATEGVANIFPIVGDHRTLEVDNLQLHRKDFSGEDHKNAILEGRSLTEPLKGDVVIKDKEGKVLDRRKGHTLMQVPYFTPLNTFVVRGNEYSVRNQLRTKPGVYTRVRGNGDLESSFNLRKGANFRLSMNPEKGHLNMEYGTSKIPLYPVLRELGMSHEDIAGQWGDNLAADNQAAFDKRRVNHAKKLYEKLTPVKKRTAVGRDQVAEAIRTSFDMTELDPTTTSKTLGQGFDKVSPQALLQASRKLLRVHRGEEEQDNRDSLEFQTLHSPEDFVRERLDLAKREFGWKTKSKLDLTSSPEVRKVLPTSALTPTLRSFLTSSQLSVAPTQINPVEILNSATNVTRFGEGGIQSSRAIPANVRTLHSSHLGVLDPFRTPESAAAGVDVGAALFASRDREGNIFTRLRNVRTGKTEHVPAAELSRATIAFPTQDVGRGRVDAISGGEVKKVRPGDVDYQVVHPQTLYGVSTNMIPFMDSQQGNRLIMASKFSQQALPLKESEEPLVQVDANSRRFKSWEQEVASKVLPLSPVDGEVTSIRKGFINIRGKDGDEHKLPYSKRHPLASKTYLSHYMKVKHLFENVETEAFRGMPEGPVREQLHPQRHPGPGEEPAGRVPGVPRPQLQRRCRHLGVHRPEDGVQAHGQEGRADRRRHARRSQEALGPVPANLHGRPVLRARGRAREAGHHSPAWRPHRCGRCQGSAFGREPDVRPRAQVLAQAVPRPVCDLGQGRAR